MSKKTAEKKPTVDKATASRLLRQVPKNEGLMLYKAPGEFTGRTVTGLADLAEKLKAVDVRAVNYHFKKREFEKWFRGTLGDEELARRFGRLNRELHGEKLRNEMLTLVRARLDELKSVG
ncbi:hypothetical protein JXL21_09315 [Candidatus Bathyarchaeota archaeon]|nr:hypothetical protein [Candidatus Bathyarchaeota archaeon]